MKFEIKDGKLFGSGNLDEESVLNDGQELPGNDFVFDLGDAKSVNSIGIRMWVKWIEGVSGKAFIRFQRVPHSFILQMNMIEGFLPANSKVESFSIPAYNDETDEEKDILMVVGRDVVIDGGEPVVKYDLSAMGPDWELDIVGNDYFKFLKR